MSVDPSLPVVIAQMGHAERVVHEAQAHPEMVQAAAQQAAAQALQHDRSQVQKTEESGKSEVVSERERNRQRRRALLMARRKARVEEEQDETPDSDDDPWSGNILNIKV
ncbi:hypothetical protein FVW20_05595 [Desulfovibrio oxamicus]|uniref:Uncharacterized protein n=1 Tax=Nitratidesulfovibrio oxamicus TaxID=32016 RepID=A0ABS0J258_9BACT|nr:hypothetical protein [Nitratidesulfovibrio oxamicus]MBG3876513.1 hypothetical protein [Nitratidesulfovibrio oxamicus]